MPPRNMAIEWRNSRRFFALFLLFLLIRCEGCKDISGKYDLTPISRFVWNVTEKHGSNVVEYTIRICNPPDGTSAVSSSVSNCSGKGGDDSCVIDLGNFVGAPTIDRDERDNGFWLKFEGASCPSGGNYRTLINFQCGSSLGSPLFIGTYGCATYFVWETSVACKKPSARKEIPCYVYDSNGNKHDLKTLVKTTSGYFLSDGFSGADFYINVCSEIVPDDATKGCPSGTGACLIVGSEAYSFGDVDGGLELTPNGNLRLTYINGGSLRPPGCTDHPRTTITFVCPKNGRERNPVILANSNCVYQVEWTTTTACPVRQLESKDGCRLISEVDGIEETLLPLRIQSGNPHHADGKVDGKMYDFYLSLCGGFPAGFNCNGSFSATVCRKSVDDHEGIVIGTSVNQSLRYADDQMYLSYVGGAPCQQTGPLSKRSMSAVILFKCGLDSGGPRFIREEDCVSFFEWETKSACIERMLGSLCYVKDNGKVFDLSSLIRGDVDGPWVAVVDDSFLLQGMEVYINVCGPVGRFGPTAGCPAGSAVCVKGVDGKMMDFGQYVKRPALDAVASDVILNYTSSVPCPSNPKTFVTSVVTFVCHPGKLDSAPRVVRSSLDGCLLELVWPTAAACVQTDISGTDCKIQDEGAGLSFDLSPLRRDGNYNVSVGNDTIYLNVCGGVNGTSCTPVDKPIGACQIEHGNTQTFSSLGLATDLLSYHDGLINLTYLGGSPYNDDARTARQTIIVFECDRDADVGYPEYLDRSEQVYNFKWKTSYACLPLPIQCTFLNEATREQFDLSKLSRSPSKDDWEIRESLPRLRSRKFYLNVCRSLTRNNEESKNACSPSAAACVTRYIDGKEIPFIRNLGMVESMPHYKEGQLVLSYTSGDVCEESKSGANYSAVVYFHCANYSVPSEEGPGPIFLRNHSCEYVFLWSNQAACPLRTSQNFRSCSITDSNTGYTFSFASLSGDFRVPASGSDTFRDFYINFCGSVGELACSQPHGIGISASHISACGHLRGKNGSLVLARSDTRRLQVSSSGFVTMQFDSPQNATTGKPDYRLEIIFICNRHANASRPRFIRQEDDLLVFHYESPLTCPPHGVDCKVHDSRGNSYDLSPLSRGSGHYEVRDPRSGKGNILYHLNVCQPVRAPPFSNCPGNIGACMSDSDSGIGYSLGYVQGKPRPVAGAVAIHYLSGSPCNNGTQHRSTRIDFICSNQHGEPQFVDETADCEYIFSWETPMACPLQQVVGSNCQVIDHRYSIHFDLSRLSKPEGYVVNESEKTFRVNVCGPLSSGCNGQSMAGICVEENGVKTSAGIFSDRLVYDQGDLSLRYIGGDKTSVIKFICDHTTTGEAEGPSFLASVSTADSFVFLWKTSYACRNFKESSCKVYGPNGTFYDLGQLMLLDGNYEFIADNGTYKYMINVCHSVVHTKADAMCHYGSAVCGVNVSEANVEKKYANLGEVGNGPYIKDGVLMLTYDMGEMCRRPGSSTLHKKTSIKFECSPTIEEGEPYLLAEDGCSYEFAWSTAAACPIQQVENIELDDCTIFNPNTGYHFDLNLLKSESYIVGTPNGYNLTIGICKQLLKSPCGPNVGSCMQSLTTSLGVDAGKANSRLHYRSETLVLNYTDGEPCAQGSKTTIITFFCGAELGSPVFLDDSGCSYLVSWHTELACEQRVHCSVEMEGEVFDLGPLGSQQGHHFAVSSVDDAVYVLNVCRPLNSFAGYECPSQSAACRIDRDGNMSLNLGSVGQAPYVGPGGHIVLDYVNGSQCPSNPRLNISTKIIFICDDSFTHDVLQMADMTPDCIYVLEWPTDLVCPIVTHGQASTNCSYYDKRTNSYFNLAHLHMLSPAGYEVKSDIEDDGGMFMVSYCGIPSGSGPCSSAAVCMDINGVQSSWGSATSAIYDYDGQVLRVAYRDGDRCSHSQSEKQTSVIYFACDLNAGPGTPELAKSFDCQVVFYWRTSLMCPGVTPDCTLLHNGHLYDLRLLSSYSHSWTINILPSRERFWFNVCGQLTGDRDPRCPLDSAVCWTMAADKLVSLGSTESQSLTISDAADQSLTLRYSTDTGVCRDGAGLISSSTQSTIEFICSLKAGEPQLIFRGNQSNNCTFSFRWETPVACPEKRQLEVLELDGKIVDANLDLTVDLSQILNLKESTVEHRGPVDYLYWIGLSGMESYPSWTECHGAAICQTKPNDSSFQRNIGFAKDRRFYLQGPQLIVVLNSDSVCARNTAKKVSSSITLRCSASAGLGRPTFLYESVDCIYLFDWESEVVCDVEAAHMQSGDVDRSASSSGVGTTIGVVILVIVIIILVIGIIFRNRERRATVASRLQDCLRKKPLSTVRYTPLPTNDTDDNEATSLLFSTRFERLHERADEDDDDNIIEF